MKNENAPSDPLRGLGRKKLRNLARKNKIKNAHLKSPASLRRAIRRAEKQTQPGMSHPTTQAKSREELLVERRKAELQAYQEHRLRYLYAPSQFAHTGTHEEFLLEKDEELNLPDYYNENQLRLLPVDPWQYYLYWDFDTETLEAVKEHLAEEAVFVLRSYDITSIAFDGSNAHGSWDIVCHPLIREWYISSPVHDRHVCAELGILDSLDGFTPLLRSNTTYIPPASVSPVRRDLFAQFIPQAATTQAEKQPAAVAPALAPPVPTDEAPPLQAQVADAFFLPFVPTPHLLNPRPEPQRVLDYATVPRFIPQNVVPVSQAHVPPPQAGRQENLPEMPPPPAPLLWPQAETASRSETPENGYLETTWQQREARWSEQLDAENAQNAGQESIRQSLGIPQGTEIRWFSELPSELTPMLFEQWITDPYDQAMFVSYSIWPWEMSEYLPLGASDWVQRKFLGASLFSWFRPAGSERMVRWQQFPGASEGARWLRPVGASERAWSGSNQPPAQREGSVWHLWPQRPLNYSGRGLFA